MISSPSLSDFGTHDESRYPELWEGCVGAWAPCLGPTGAKLHDFSGGNNWGALTNMNLSADWILSGKNYALDFDGTDDRVLCFNKNDFLSGGMTVSAWLKRANTTASFRAFFGKFFRTGGSPTTEGGFIARHTNTNQLDFALVRPNFPSADTHRFTSTSDVMNTTDLVHVAASFRSGDGSAAKMYFNGSEIAATWILLNGNVTLVANTAAQTIATIGPYDGSYLQHWQGAILGVTQHFRELSPSEMRLLASDPLVLYQRRRRQSYFATEITPAFKASWIKKPSQLIGGGTY